MKYQVTVIRKEYREHIFEVDADTKEEAEDKAMEASADHDFYHDMIYDASEYVTLVYASNTAKT